MPRSRSPRPAESARPKAERHTGAETRASRAGKAAIQRNVASIEDRSTREFFGRLAHDKKAGLKFLQEAGILDAKGALAKPYRS